SLFCLQAEDGIRDFHVTGVQTCALPISSFMCTGKAHVIKSHHNVGGLPEHMKLGLVEPLRELFKDEVRRLGVELGLPRTMVYRQDRKSVVEGKRGGRRGGRTTGSDTR